MQTEFSIVDSLDNFKSRLINKTLVGISILVLINQVFVTIRTLKYDNWLGLALISVSTLLVIGAALFRNKLQTSTKSYILIIAISFALISGLISFGFLASGKYYILIAPIILSFIVSVRQTIRILILFVLVYLIFAVLYTSGLMTYNYDTSLYAGSYISWAVDLGNLLIGSFGFIYFSGHFNDEIVNNYSRIETQNKELRLYKDHLEQLVKERTNDLRLVNTELEEKNIELNEVLDHLRTTQTQLFESEKMASLGVLTAGVSHEINNPLNFIMGGYTGLNEYFNEPGVQKDERIEMLLNSIATGVNRASEIVKGLNQFSRTNQNFNEECDINEIVKNCLLMLNNQLRNNIDIDLKLSANPLVIKGNTGKLHQVVINILTNSIQAIPDKGNIYISTEEKAEGIVIKIKDDGTGISKENLSRITEPFFTTKEPGKGTGLGLAISYSIIKDHQGKLEFKSGKGTAVTVTLPRQKS